MLGIDKSLFWGEKILSFGGCLFRVEIECHKLNPVNENYKNSQYNISEIFFTIILRKHWIYSIL